MWFTVNPIPYFQLFSILFSLGSDRSNTQRSVTILKAVSYFNVAADWCIHRIKICLLKSNHRLQYPGCENRWSPMDLRPARCQKQQRPGPGRWNRLNLLTVSCVYQRRPGIFIKKKNANYELKKKKIKKPTHLCLTHVATNKKCSSWVLFCDRRFLKIAAWIHSFWIITLVSRGLLKKHNQMFTTFVFPAFQKGISKNKRRLSVTVQPDCTSLLSTTGHMCRGVKIKSTFHLPVRRHIPHIFWYLLCPVQWWPSQIKVQTGRAWLESGHRFKERLHVQHMREFPGSPRRSFFISNHFIDLERFHCKVVKEEDTKCLVCIYKIYINTLQSQIHVPWV